jgi:hypothetical protein
MRASAVARSAVLMRRSIAPRDNDESTISLG